MALSAFLRLSLLHGVLIIGVLWAILPMLWIALAAFQPYSRLFQYPPQWLPQSLYLENFDQVFTRTRVPVQMLNSTIVAGSTAVIVAVVGSLAAYAFARFQFRLREAMFMAVLATQMIPAITKIIPLYLLMQSLGAINTHWSLVLVYVGVSLPLGIWILTGFYRSIPREIEEAAFLDGCGRVGTFVRVALPLALPGLAAVAILTFVQAWNDFVIALILVQSEGMKTYQLGLFDFLTDAAFRQQTFGVLNAASVLGLVPTLVGYLLVQRHFMAGLTAGAVK